MFGGFGGALKNLTEKAEEVMEKTKREVEELAQEKKQAASVMLEQHAKKTGDALWNTKSDLEKSAVGAVMDAKKSALDGFDKELLPKKEKSVEESLKEQIEPDTDAAAPDAASSAAEAAKSLVSAGALGGVENQIESTVDGAVQQVSSAVDSKLKEADQFLDEKREEVVKQIHEASAKATDSAEEGLSSMLGKAKGLLPF